LGFILVIVTYKSLCPYEIFISVEWTSNRSHTSVEFSTTLKWTENACVDFSNLLTLASSHGPCQLYLTLLKLRAYI
jgi:hypothetical protein